MLDPIKASIELKNSYIDYITTTFDVADPDYKKQLEQELRKEGMVAKGPFLDIGGSFESGKTLHQLIEIGKASPLFEQLEPIPEKDRELKLDRPLYSHQEESLLKASAGKSLIVTTGTGSGKTESFLLPIINHLLQEIEDGTITAGVRAIIIYPMNALANDQMKRMRALLQKYPNICYGVYNGNTAYTQSEALSDYHKTYKNANGEPLDPAPNEIISREVMQRTPPHILITNYSMLEYMMLRPKDDLVFSGSKLRYVVLDEAHIYRGATGMETSLLMRRLRARISDPDSVQYILTSATLGDLDANQRILQFAERLCGVHFYSDGIIRAKEKRPQMVDLMDFPTEMFDKLKQFPQDTEKILVEYHADFAPQRDESEKLYELFLRSRLFDVLRKVSIEPVTVTQIHQAMSKIVQITTEQVVNFVAVCARAEKDGASLIKPRYHFFVRAIEGAYITLKAPKKLYLQRKLRVNGLEQDSDAAVFEAAICTDCGRIAVIGRSEGNMLIQSSKRAANDVEYFCIKDEADGEFLEDPDSTEENNGMEDYVLCAVCGAISTEADLMFKSLCSHDSTNYVKVRKVKIQKNGHAKCPVCGFGNFRRFYLGSEAATSVLGTELFDQLPSEEITIEPVSETRKVSLFAHAPRQKQKSKVLSRQFLCFSDSRSEAAFFATYMERSYQEFLRRRGIWHVAEKMKEEQRTTVSVAEFVNELSRYFESKRSFADWDTEENGDADTLSAISKQNAWIAILNEMYNARRSTSLVSMGVLSFEFKKNDGITDGIQ